MADGFVHPFGQPVTQVVLDSLEPDLVRVEGEDAHHLAHALRLAPGGTFVATDGRGNVAHLEAQKVERRGIEARVLERATVPAREPRLWLVAEAAGGRGDWIVEKAVELGAHAFLPLGEATAGRGARWGRVARAGLKQSLSAWELRFPEGRAIDRAREVGPKATWIAHPGGEPVLSQVLPPQGDVFLVSGAPSGFAPGEREAFEGLEGAKRVDLGDLRLRAETAALLLLAAAALGRRKL